MRRIMTVFSALALLLYFGCSNGGGEGGPLLASHNSVYAVNALSTDENISLYVGDEVPETVASYAKEPVIVEKATGIDNIVYYLVAGDTPYGRTLLEKNRTYFYAATDCNISTDTVYALAHKVETDTQINIVNTSSSAFSQSDINISVDGTQINGPSTDSCMITPVAVQSVKDQNITVSFPGGEIVSKLLPSDVSVDIVIYHTPPQEAGIILLPRLTPDAL